MSEPKFTPGPWKADLERYPIFIESETERWPLPDEGEGWTSAFVANVGDNKANAHLIAAAPELYEALYLALPYIEEAEKDPCYKPGSVAAVTKQIRSAINRAEGEG